MDTDTQRCTGHKQIISSHRGQYECILTPSAALAINRSSVLTGGCMSVYSHPALHWPQTDHQFSQGQYECILTPSAALATNRTISSHRGQYECILTPSAALATNRSSVLTGAVRVDTDTQRCTGHKQDHQFSQGQYECILTPSAALATNRSISSHRGSMSGY